MIHKIIVISSAILCLLVALWWYTGEENSLTFALKTPSPTCCKPFYLLLAEIHMLKTFIFSKHRIKGNTWPVCSRLIVHRVRKVLILFPKIPSQAYYIGSFTCLSTQAKDIYFLKDRIKEFQLIFSWSWSLQDYKIIFRCTSFDWFAVTKLNHRSIFFFRLILQGLYLQEKSI